MNGPCSTKCTIWIFNWEEWGGPLFGRKRPLVWYNYTKKGGGIVRNGWTAAAAASAKGKKISHTYYALFPRRASAAAWRCWGQYGQISFETQDAIGANRRLVEIRSYRQYISLHLSFFHFGNMTSEWIEETNKHPVVLHKNFIIGLRKNDIIACVLKTVKKVNCLNLRHQTIGRD